MLVPMVIAEPVVLGSRHAVVHQVLVHFKSDGLAEGQIQGEKPFMVINMSGVGNKSRCPILLIRQMSGF